MTETKKSKAVERTNKKLAEEKEKVQKIKKLTEKLDETIEVVCEKVKENDLCPGEYADTLKALAALMEARARLI